MMTTGFFILRFEIKKFENRGGHCADTVCNGGQGCCQSSSCAITSCNYTIIICRRIPPKPYSHLPIIDTTACASNAIKYINFGVRERYGLPVTMNLFGFKLVSSHLKNRDDNVAPKLKYCNTKYS